MIKDYPRARRAFPDGGMDAARRPEAGRGIHIGAADRVMVIAPHPDDESLATGGLLQAARWAGAAIRITFLTDGENNPWAQVAVEGLWPLRATDRMRWARRRRAETFAALAQLGVDDHCAVFLGFPDQGLTDLLVHGDNRATRAVAGEVVAWRPTVLVVPSLDDAHPDHSAASVMIAFALAGLARRDRPRRVYSYLVHKGIACRRAAWEVFLDPAQRQHKREAILCHKSQLRWRRQQLLALARDGEWYEAPFEPRARVPGHPVRLAHVAAGELRLECDRPGRFRIGPTVLRVAAVGPTGAMVRLSLALPTRSSRVSVRDTVTRRVVGTASCVCGAATIDLHLTLEVAAPLGLGFVKLERPVGRRLGFFDSVGWRSVTAMKSSSRGISPPGMVEQVCAELEMAK